ncbi:MAG: O-antigen ligase family protein [Dehalococcoidia bacterium]
MIEIGAIVFVQLAFLAAVIILREPKLLIPCVVLGLPFEYAATVTLSSLGEGGVGGIIRTMLNPGKAAMIATIVIGAIRVRHNPRALFPNSAVILPLTVLLFVVVLGVAWSGTLRPSNGVLIMPMYVAFVFVAPSLIEDRQDLERIALAFFAAASMLAVVAIAQRLLGVFQWREILIGSDDVSYRSNAFFADPNNLARFLAISMALAVGFILVTGPRRMTVYVAAPMLAICTLGIVMTASRSGWLGMLLASFLVVMLTPIRGYTKARLACVGLGGLVFLLGLLFLQGGANAERVKSLTSGVELLGQRSFLIKGGWEMWKDNPLVGVGSGNYQHTLTVSYLWTLPGWATTTLSHTSLISVLAELGIVGVGVVCLFAFRMVVACRAAFVVSRERYSRLMAAWCAAALVEIFFQSQSEGRLLDEPFLYVVLAILAALELGAGARGTDPVVEGEPAVVGSGERARKTARVGLRRGKAVPMA